MVKFRTLNELPQLRDSDFNQPSPRHGIKLLFWFANVNQFNPENGDFGFHRFYNRIEDDEDKLLPDQNLPYYEVGNLNDRGAENLPKYVRPHNRRYYGDGNKDRIIVRLNNGRFDRVYVTEHVDQWNFDPDRTFRISQGLLDQIKGMDKDVFLKKMQEKQHVQLQSQSRIIYTEQNNRHANEQQRDESGSWCTIL